MCGGTLSYHVSDKPSVVFTVQTGRRYKSNIHNIIWCFSISVILFKSKIYIVFLFLRLHHPTPTLRSKRALR